MTQYSTETRMRKYVKGYGFLSFARKYKKKTVIGYRTSVKTAPKKVHNTGAFLGSKIAEKIGNPKHMIDESLRNVKEIIIPPEKKEEILNELKQVL